MTTYLTWLVPDGGDGNMPEERRKLRPVNAKGPKHAAAVAATRWVSERTCVDVGVCRADLIESWRTWSRRYTVVFTRVLKEVRRC